MQQKVELFAQLNSRLLCIMIYNGEAIKAAEMTLILKSWIQGSVNKALTETGSLKGQVTKAEAYRLYGRAQVDRWLKEGLLAPSNARNSNRKSGISRVALEAITAISNPETYLPSAER